MRAIGRARAALAAALFLAGCLGAHAAAQALAPAGAQGRAARRAILVRGADAVKGLPFFSPNALAALVGSYDLAGLGATAARAPAPGAAPGTAPGAAEARVWYTREPLVLGGAWRRTDLEGSLAYSLAQDGGAVLLLKDPGYYLFFEFSKELAPDEAGRRAFVLSFERKFQVFFQNASNDAELSFPAYVDY